MLKKYKNIIRYTLLTGLVLYFIFKITIPVINSISNIKKKEFINLPIEYLSLFNSKIRGSVLHVNTISTLDSTNYPVSRVKLDGHNIAIIKFNSKFPLEKILNIKYKKTEITRFISYTPLNLDNTKFSYSINLKKKIDFIELYAQKPFDTIIMSNNLFIGKGELKTLSFKFSKADKGNVIVIKKNSFLSQEYNIVFIKKEEFIYMLFIDMAMSKEKIYDMLNLSLDKISPAPARSMSLS